jgi:hypothetical protein
MGTKVVEQPTAEMAERIASSIANCDFRVTLSRYMCSKGYPWIVTVGEHDWQRHIVIESVTPDASDANLVILSPEESRHFGYDINWRAAERRMTLKELVSDGSYGSVIAALRPELRG